MGRTGKLRFRIPVIAGLLVMLGSYVAMMVMISALHQAELAAARNDATIGAEAVADNLAAGRPLGDSAVLTKNEVSWALYNSSGKLITIGRISGGVVGIEDLDGAQLPVVRGQNASGSANGLTSVEDVGTDLAVGTRFSTVAGEQFKVVAVATVDRGHTVENIVARSALWWSPLLALFEGLIVYVAVRGLLSTVADIGHTTRDIAQLGDLDQRVTIENRNDELSQLAGMFNDMLTRLEHSGQNQRQFISDASHELRSPLTSLTNSIDLLKAHPELLDEDIVNLMGDETARLGRIVSDLLVLARNENRDPQLADIDTDDVVFSLAERVRRSGREVAVNVHPVRIRAELVDVEIVFGNLVSNAIRHSRRTVSLDLRDVGSRLEFSVGDDGNGVPSAARDAIFERFVRLDESRARDDGGSGLGLAVVRRVLDGYGATVKVDDSELGGARFTVSWPKEPVCETRTVAKDRRKVKVTHKNGGPRP